jgi:hypothetical protein
LCIAKRTMRAGKLSRAVDSSVQNSGFTDLIRVLGMGRSSR